MRKLYINHTTSFKYLDRLKKEPDLGTSCIAGGFNRRYLNMLGKAHNVCYYASVG